MRRSQSRLRTREHQSYDPDKISEDISKMGKKLEPSWEDRDPAWPQIMATDGDRNQEHQARSKVSVPETTKHITAGWNIVAGKVSTEMSHPRTWQGVWKHLY